MAAARSRCLFCGAVVVEGGWRLHAAVCISQQNETAAINQARDEAMARVSAKAETHSPGFGVLAEGFVLHYLAEHGPTPGELVNLACKQSGIAPPHDDRAFGSVYMRLSKRGRIVKVGSVKRRRGHNTEGGIVWALA